MNQIIAVLPFTGSPPTKSIDHCANRYASTASPANNFANTAPWMTPTARSASGLSSSSLICSEASTEASRWRCSRLSPTTCPNIPIASDRSSPALAHNPRSSSKPVSATPSPARQVLAHSAVLGRMRIAVRSGSLAGSASATRRARSQLIRAARISRLLDQAPARMCQAYAARRSPAASRCSAIRAAFSPTDVVVALFDGGGEPPVQLGAIRLELGFVGDRANQRMVEHILGLAGEFDLIDELGCHQVGNDGFDA